MQVSCTGIDALRCHGCVLRSVAGACWSSRGIKRGNWRV